MSMSTTVLPATAPAERTAPQRQHPEGTKRKKLTKKAGKKRVLRTSIAPARPKPPSSESAAVSASEVTPVQAAKQYAASVDMAKSIKAEHRAQAKPIEVQIASMRSEFAAALMGARQEQIDTFRFVLYDGSCRYLTSKQNTTYRHVKRQDVEHALRLVSAEAVCAVHAASPTKTLAECIAQVLIDQLKRALLRTSTLPVFKGPPNKSQAGNAAPVIRDASPEMVRRYGELHAKLDEVKQLRESRKRRLAAEEQTKKRLEPKVKAYLARRRDTQQALTLLTPLGQPNEHVILRLRETKPRAAPALTIAKLAKGKFPLSKVTMVLPRSDEAEFTLDDARAVLGDGSQLTQTVMQKFDLVRAEYAEANITAPQHVLRLAKKRPCRNASPSTVEPCSTR